MNPVYIHIHIPESAAERLRAAAGNEVEFLYRVKCCVAIYVPWRAKCCACACVTVVHRPLTALTDFVTTTAFEGGTINRVSTCFMLTVYESDESPDFSLLFTLR